MTVRISHFDFFYIYIKLQLVLLKDFSTQSVIAAIIYGSFANFFNNSFCELLQKLCTNRKGFFCKFSTLLKDLGDNIDQTK